MGARKLLLEIMMKLTYLVKDLMFTTSKHGAKKLKNSVDMCKYHGEINKSTNTIKGGSI